ncbi:MAG: type I 3-dehydroquinate dehydratase [Waddliaceae bacterium]
MCTMLCLSLKNIPEVPIDPKVSLVELRLDLNPDLLEYRSQIKVPVILTDRGCSPARLKELIDLNPDYIDTEEPQGQIQNLIYSYHNYEKTPTDLESLVKEMRKVPARLYKIACFANSSLDALRLAKLSSQYPDVLAFAIGDAVSFSRFLASPWIYCALNESERTAPGQPTVDEAKKFEKGDNYALIGGQLEKSHSDEIHNAYFEKMWIQAKYLKIPLKKEELSFFFSCAATLGFKGFSITMPHKSDVIPLFDHIDETAQKIGAINTAHLKNGKWYGSNTDAKGALDAIEDLLLVKGKHLLLIGLGGSAKAVAYEAIQRGARVSVTGRAEKPFPFGTFISMSQIHQFPYDILVNATPHPMPIDKSEIIPGSIVMDLKSQPSTLLFCAKSKGCQTILGSQMWMNQALLQYATWFG